MAHFIDNQQRTVGTALPPPGLPHFLAVAETGSFRAAARQLGLSPAAVSKGVSRLEAALGVLLFARTTRSVGLTPEGRRYLGHARRALAALRVGQEELQSASAAVGGRVRVSLSPVLSPLLAPVWARALERHPALELELDCTDDLARLTQDAVDIAVRIGTLQDSSLVALPLGRLRWVTVASPSWVATRPQLRAPEDLLPHRCLVYRGPDGQTVPPRFQRGPGQIQALQPAATLRTTSGRGLLDGALAGVGAAQLFRFLADPYLERGSLVELLAEWVPPGPPLHALVRAERRRLKRVRAVLDVLRDVLAGALPMA